MSAYRRGYVLHMWTGLVLNERTSRPIVFRTEDSAVRYLSRMAGWGRHAVKVRPVRVRPGSNGLPDYIIT